MLSNSEAVFDEQIKTLARRVYVLSTPPALSHVHTPVQANIKVSTTFVQTIVNEMPINCTSAHVCRYICASQVTR